jgi:hypothetical protein
MRHLFLSLVILAHCQLVRGTELVGGDILGDDLVRVLFGISNKEALNDSRLKAALLESFPLGSSWSDAKSKLQKIVAPNEVSSTSWGSVFWLNRQRHITCQLVEDAGNISCGIDSLPTKKTISQHYRNWNFAMRFTVLSRGGKGLESVYTSSLPVESSCFSDHDTECLAEVKSECESAGGTWRTDGSRGQISGDCVRPTKDEGKLCAESSQCEGTCRPELENGHPVRQSVLSRMFSLGSPSAICHCSATTAPLPRGMIVYVCTKDGIQGFHLD